MYKYGTQLPKIQLRTSLGADDWALIFHYKHGITTLELDQQPEYDASDIRLANGDMVNHFAGYRSMMTITFTDHYLSDTETPDTDYRLGRSELGYFMDRIRGWVEAGHVIRVYPHRDTLDYFDAYIPVGGLTMTPRNIDGQPKSKITDYSLTLIAKSLTSTKWQGTAVT